MQKLFRYCFLQKHTSHTLPSLIQPSSDDLTHPSYAPYSGVQSVQAMSLVSLF